MFDVETVAPTIKVTAQVVDDAEALVALKALNRQAAQAIEDALQFTAGAERAVIAKAIIGATRHVYRNQAEG